MVGEIETSYQRAGAGRAVVLLVPPPRDPAVLAPMVARWRVIVPESTSVLALPDVPGHSPFAMWFRGFLEGLGVHGAMVVAETPLAIALATVQAQWPGLIAHVELLGPAPHDWDEVAQSLGAVAAD